MEKSFLRQFVRTSQKLGKFQELETRKLDGVRMEIVTRDDFDSWDRYYLVETPNTRKAVAILKEQGLAIFPRDTEFYSAYDCTGRSFIWNTSIRRIGNFTLVKCSWCVDC